MESDGMNYFGRVACVTLDRRADRWNQFQKVVADDWPFGTVEKYSAIDGQKCPPPDWFTCGGGAWGCGMSHIRLIEDCLNRGINRVLLLEDDAVPAPDLTKRWEAFLSNLPKDWDVLYLGGQHLFVFHDAPKKVAEGVYRAYNVNRTHAWALQGSGLEEAYKHLNSNHKSGGSRQIIDNHMGRLLMQGDLNAYCPGEWLFAQRHDVYSDVVGKVPKPSVWHGAAFITNELIQHQRAHTTPNIGNQRARSKPAPARGGRRQRLPFGTEHYPFVAVLGIHSSGTSATAGVLHHLGVYLGRRLTGYYGRNPDKNCGFEATGLIQIIRQWLIWPKCRPHGHPLTVRPNLQQYIFDAQQEAAENGSPLAGAKHPILCSMGDMLRFICRDNLKVIHVDRPLEDSIRAFIRREPRRNAKTLEKHQRWLNQQKEELLDTVPHLTVSYPELLENPRKICEEISTYLSIHPTSEQIEKALAWIDPNKCHIRPLALEATK